MRLLKFLWWRLKSNLQFTPEVRYGGKASMECSVTVGQQYNTVSMQPVYAAWLRYCSTAALLWSVHYQVWLHSDMGGNWRTLGTELESRNNGLTTILLFISGTDNFFRKTFETIWKLYCHAVFALSILPVIASDFLFSNITYCTYNLLFNEFVLLPVVFSCDSDLVTSTVKVC